MREVRKGRGAASNRSGRYERHQHETFDDGWGTIDDAQTPLRTEVRPDTSRTVITRNDSPDLGFDRSINVYRGCEHGCVYCYARPTHAYLGLSPGQDFESRIFAKHDAPAQLERELARPGYECRMIAMGTNTDPYQPTERRLAITRGVLEVLDRHDHPVGIVTKSALVTRDADILSRMAKRRLATVALSVTTLDRDLARTMEPRASTPAKRLEAMSTLGQAGVPVGVMVAPIVPGLTDHEMETILEAARKEAGANRAGYVVLQAAAGGAGALPGMALGPCAEQGEARRLPVAGDARGPAQRPQLRLPHDRRRPLRRSARGPLCRRDATPRSGAPGA